MKKLIAVGLVLCLAQAASASVVHITEYQYKGDGGEFVEFTNFGPGAVDFTGWTYDDSSADPNDEEAFDLSGFGTVAEGESIILSLDPANDFIAEWNLSGVQVLSGYSNKLGREDQINLYDDSNTLVDSLTYNDEAGYPLGGPRTDSISANPPVSALGTDIHADWEASFVGDAFGSYQSVSGGIGNPGTYVPEPATIAFLLVGGVMLHRRG